MGPDVDSRSQAPFGEPRPGWRFHDQFHDGVTLGFSSQNWLTWVLPLAVVVGLFVLGVICLGLLWCWKKRGAKRRSGRPSARSAQVAPSDA